MVWPLPVTRFVTGSTAREIISGFLGAVSVRLRVGVVLLVVVFFLVAGRGVVREAVARGDLAVLLRTVVLDRGGVFLDLADGLFDAAEVLRFEVALVRAFVFVDFLAVGRLRAEAFFAPDDFDFEELALFLAPDDFFAVEAFFLAPDDFFAVEDLFAVPLLRLAVLFERDAVFFLVVAITVYPPSFCNVFHNIVSKLRADLQCTMLKH